MEYTEKAPVKGFGRFILDFIDDVCSDRLLPGKAHHLAEELIAEIDELTMRYNSSSPEGTGTLRRYMLESLDLYGESLSEVLRLLERKQFDAMELETAREMALKASQIIAEIERISEREEESFLKDELCNG